MNITFSLLISYFTGFIKRVGVTVIPIAKASTIGESPAKSAIPAPPKRLQ